VCQILSSVVNQLPDDPLRRVLVVCAEELFNSTFRDYSFVYDPREASSPSGEKVKRSSSAGRDTVKLASKLPKLPEETLTGAMPYSAMVQSLRDTAKDAIMQRLEIEARLSNAGGGLELGSGEVPVSLRAREEVRLREELRHARVLADTYQVRTIELERKRVELLEEARRAHAEKERDDVRRQQLSAEVRRLRADVEAAKVVRLAVAQEARNSAASSPSGRSARPIISSGSSGGAARVSSKAPRPTGSPLTSPRGSVSEGPRGSVSESSAVGSQSGVQAEEDSGGRLRRGASGASTAASTGGRSPSSMGRPGRVASSTGSSAGSVATN